MGGFVNVVVQMPWGSPRSTPRDGRWEVHKFHHIAGQSVFGSARTAGLRFSFVGDKIETICLFLQQFLGKAKFSVT